MDNNTTQIKTVSRFEFAIMQIADPEAAKLCRPITVEEENRLREQKIRTFVSQIKSKK